MKRITLLNLCLILNCTIVLATVTNDNPKFNLVEEGNCDVECPDDFSVMADANDMFTIPDYIASGLVTVNCANGTVTQTPAPGTVVGLGDTDILIEAMNAIDDDDCDFTITVTNTVGGDCEIICPDEVFDEANANGDYVVPDFVNSGTVVISGCANPTITQTPAPGTIIGVGIHDVEIEVTSVDGDDDCDFELIVTQTLGVDNTPLASLSMYPNPAKSVVRFSISLDSISVYSLQGELIIETVGSSINLDDLSTGIYFVKVELDDRSITKKLMVD